MVVPNGLNLHWGVILSPLKAEAPDNIISSDASGSWVCGAFKRIVPNTVG